MARKSSVDFKVIIVGGSVAGLTLAHALDSAHIDYIILEARNSIAPPLGATIVIHPNGARILDQMGIYEPLRKIMIPLNQVFSRRADGRIINCTEWTPIIQDRLGYTPAIFERQKFLQSLYEQLKDKSKVYLNKRVTAVKDRADSILVRCEDGTEFIGDVVVGADGIHSKVRREMQRHAEETGPPGLVDNDKNCITSEYNCFFGVSEPIPELREGNLHTVYDIDQSGLLFVGNKSLPQWFFITKMDKKYQGDEIPRFNKADMENQVLQRGDFQFTAGLTLKRLMATTKTLSYLALEEAIHEVWTYDRIVCLGDSIHKMTPNLGQGGNQTIEGVAVLTNCLLEMLDRSPGHYLTTAEIEQALRKYQLMRQRRATKFVEVSAVVTRDEALATFRHSIKFLSLPALSSDKIADIQTEMCATASHLNHLPLPTQLEGNKFWGHGTTNLNMSKYPKAQL